MFDLLTYILARNNGDGTTDFEAFETLMNQELAKKTDIKIDGTNGKSSIFNEEDGGGAKFDGDNGVVAYVGTHDNIGGEIGTQIYVDKADSSGSIIIDVTQNGAYYTKGAILPGSQRDVYDNELVTFKDIAEAIAVEEARAKAAENKKVDKEISGANGIAYIFNESDGGGAKFINNDGVESFIGVNDGGADGIAAQIYADKYVDGKWQGAKLDISNNGIYYTVGNKSAVERMVDGNELATMADIDAAEPEALSEEEIRDICE